MDKLLKGLEGNSCDRPESLEPGSLERDDQRVLLAVSRAVQGVNIIRTLGRIAKLELLKFAGACVRMGWRIRDQTGTMKEKIDRTSARDHAQSQAFAGLGEPDNPFLAAARFDAAILAEWANRVDHHRFVASSIDEALKVDVGRADLLGRRCARGRTAEQPEYQATEDQGVRDGAGNWTVIHAFSRYSLPL
jgi:hypothetical protein